MATIIPFKVIHPAPGLWQEIAALPYDVYSREEARKAVQGHPLSFLNIDRPETQFAPDQDMYAPEVYKKSEEMFRRELAEGDFVQDPEKTFYLYELTMDGRSQTGIVACASIDGYLNGIIKRHENTREEKEQDRIRHVEAVGAQTGPIFLAYRHSEIISQVTSVVKEGKPVFDFISEDGIRHRGWQIKDAEQTDAITGAFRSMDAVYIADGHHRAASAVKVGLKEREKNPGYTGKEEFNYFLSVLFPDDDLMIMDYNRVLKDLHGLTTDEFLEKVNEKCTVKPENKAVRPSRKGECGLFTGGRWYRIMFRPEYVSADPVDGLDVSVLQKEILEPVLGIGDPRTDSRIDFVGGIRGLSELEKRCHADCAAAFSMYPTNIHELFAVADAGRLMPPKSTWFEPKLRSGLFIHRIEE